MRVIQVFLSADMRCGHDGLKEVAKQAKISTDELAEGEFVVFINRGKDRLKLFAANNVVAYYKTRKGERLALSTLPLMLRSFKATGQLDYDKALKKTILHALARR